MSANNKQVAGDHYRTSKDGVQHWDYSVAVNVPNLEYAASKYMTRWYKKNGIEDLEKALHYMEKRLECYNSHVGIVKAANRNQGLFNRYIADNKIVPHERDIVDLIMHWRGTEQLERIVSSLKDMVDEMKCGPTSGYVNQG